MPLWLWLVDSLALVVVLAALLVVALVVRRRLVTRRNGGFDLSLNRRTEATVRGWTLGVAVYGPDSLDWYRTFSLSPRPSHRFGRDGLVVDGRREPTAEERHALHAGHVIVAVEHQSGVHQLALSPRALTGLLAWLESQPPGHGVNRVL